MINLIGYIEGVEISFDFYPLSTFIGVIPKKLNGKYVVELHAVDAAGNVTSLTGIHVLIDFEQLGFKVLEDSYDELQRISDFSTQEYQELHNEIDQKSLFDYSAIGSDFGYRELVME